MTPKRTDIYICFVAILINNVVELLKQFAAQIEILGSRLSQKAFKKFESLGKSKLNAVKNVHW